MAMVGIGQPMFGKHMEQTAREVTQAAVAVSATQGRTPAPEGRGGKRWVRLAALALAAAATLAGCGGGPGSREEFVEILMRDDVFNENEAVCVADAVFDEYAADEDALGRISGASDYETLTSEDGVPGFDAFLTAAVTDCTSAGPQLSDS